MTHGIVWRTSRTALIVCGIGVACVALLRAWSEPSHWTIRHRLGFSVVVDGEVKSASSVLELFFHGGGWKPNPKNGARRYSDLNGGVAPILDLGSRGMLAAAMFTNGDEAVRRKRAYGLSCKNGSDYLHFWAVFGLYPSDLVKLRELRRELPEKYYPSFIWIPNGASFRDAQQICWEEIPKMISGVTFQSAWIELAPDAPLITLLPISAPWLDELRKNQVQGIQTASHKYKINRLHQLETQILLDDPRYDVGESLKP